jgi:hypothetical protein
MSVDVFWAEAHDEVQSLISDKMWLRRRLIAIFLLSNKIIIHPSYIWRSDITRSAIFHSYKFLFSSTTASLILGDSLDVESYIFNRLHKLGDQAKHGVLSLEFKNYVRNMRNIPLVKIIFFRFTDV